MASDGLSGCPPMAHPRVHLERHYLEMTFVGTLFGHPLEGGRLCPRWKPSQEFSLDDLTTHLEKQDDGIFTF
jgi:hypothetical protein